MPSGYRYRIRASSQIWFLGDLLVSLLENETGRAVLDQRCELRDEIGRPLWVLYLDGLMSGLLPQGSRLTVQIRAETLFTWLACICAIHEGAEEGNLNADPF